MTGFGEFMAVLLAVVAYTGFTSLLTYNLYDDPEPHPLVFVWLLMALTLAVWVIGNFVFGWRLETR